MRLGELVRGSRILRTIERNDDRINTAAASSSVDANLIRAIIFEEQSHQVPFEAALESRGVGNTVGLGQMTVGEHGTREQLLDPDYNIGAMARHLRVLQSQELIDPSRPVASLATKYNCGSCTVISAYGVRVERFHAQFSESNRNAEVER